MTNIHNSLILSTPYSLVRLISLMKLFPTCGNSLHSIVSVVEHKDLNAVWTELLNSWGNEIYMKVRVLNMNLFLSLFLSPMYMLK